MMPDLEKIYDPAFFAEWGSGHAAYVQGARKIVDVLNREFHPKRIVDLGCGCGVYAHAFGTAGVTTLAIDGVRPPREHCFPVDIQIRDLTVPFDNIWGEFDFTLCLEVAEHIPESLADSFLDNLIRFSDTLLLSAAPPNQGGHHHVNEQPKRYWVQKLGQRGFVYDRPITGRLMEIFKQDKPPFMWMVEHISVYRRSPGPLTRQTLPFSVRLNGKPGKGTS